MVCPKCGLERLEDQKFCRGCGTRVQMTTQRLARPQGLTDRERASVADARRSDDRASPFVRWGFIVMFLGVAIGVVGKLLLHADIVTVVGVLLSLAGMFLVGYPYLAPPRRRKEVPGFSATQEVLTPPERSAYLPDGSRTEFIPSITERTTDLLKESPKKSPEQAHDKTRET